MDSRKDLTKLLELIQKWNDISSVVVVVACVWAVLRSNITSRWSVNHTASEAAFEDSQRYFEWACTVAGTGAVIEGTYLLSSSGRENSVTGTHSALDSKVMLLIYVSLSFFYMAMSLTGMVLVHSDELAVGGPRPVYTLRFVQWCACVPLLMLVGGRHQPAPSEVEKVLSELLLHPVQSKPRPPSWQDALEGLQEFPTTLKKALWDAPLAASVRLTVIYMIAAWLALVVDDDLSRWVLICVAFSAYFVASLQQLAMLVVMKNEQGHCICAWLMALQVLIFAGHGTVYLCACFNLISSPREQKLFACLDIFTKLGHTMVLLTSRRRADYLEECCLRNSAINAASDLQRMIQEANVPIFTVNNNLEVDGWNLKIAELTGRSPDTANISLNELIADGDDYLWKSAAIELINDALAGRVTHTAQVHFIKSEDGKEETVTVAVSATPLRSPNGEVRGAVCVGQDVTELTSQRQEAQTLAASLSNLIDMAAAPIFQVGMDCCITEWNRWLVEASGLSKMQVLGERLISVICASCRLNVTKMVKLSLEHKRTEVFEITLETANVTLLVNATTLVDSSGNPTGAICIGQDITKLKDIDDWKSSMMAMVSHELKSPLHGIIGLSHSLLEDESTTSGAKKPLAMINSSAMRLLDIVSNMMDASRLARQPLIGITKDPVQLASIIEEVVLLCQQAVDKRGVPTLRHGVKLINSVSKTLPVIEADAYRCTQLMYNLISNAIKFTNQGSVTISASADDVEQMVTVDVKDTGIGISPENIDTIFQPFDQEDRSEQRKYEGLGLGLAICREVVQKHGGNLTVKSLKGKGSTFRVTLPYKVRDYQDENDASTVAGDNGTGLLPATPKVQSRNTTMTSQNSMPQSVQSVRDVGDVLEFERQRSQNSKPGIATVAAKNLQITAKIPEDESCCVVLSVDDDLVNQQVMKSLLASSPYDLKVAVHGGEALNFLRENPLPALVLLEVMMPGLSGTDVLRTLRKSYPAEILPIIMVSAKGDKDTIVRCLKIGANDFVQKPFGQAEVIARIELQLKLTKAYRHPNTWMRPAKPKEKVIAPEFFQGVLPDDLVSALLDASKKSASSTAKEVVRSRVERFIGQSGAKLERALDEAYATIEKLKQQIWEMEVEFKCSSGAAQQQAVKLQQQQCVQWQAKTKLRMVQLKEEVERREKSLHNLKTWQNAQNAAMQVTALGQGLADYEETLMLKEIRLNQILEQFVQAEREEMLTIFRDLKEQAMQMMQESTRKDQLLLDANFRLHILAMTVAQKDIQLGLCLEDKFVLPGFKPGS